ncbi:MAG: sarcosine oxidase subunit gamma family protein [Granulosicoccus sp.]
MKPGIDVLEQPPTGLLTIHVTSSSLKAVANAVKELFALAWPERLQSTVADALCLRSMSPDEFLLSCPLDAVADIKRKLRASIKESFAVVDVSGGYVVLELAGPDHKALLKKSTAYDVHSRNFPVGKNVNTTFAKTQVTLRSVSESQVEIIVRRSYSDYVWLWIQTAAREYGLNAQRPDHNRSTVEQPT